MLTEEELTKRINIAANAVHKSVLGPLTEVVQEGDSIKSRRIFNQAPFQALMVIIANTTKEGGESSEKTQ